jgi:hypothetical protein
MNLYLSEMASWFFDINSGKKKKENNARIDYTTTDNPMWAAEEQRLQQLRGPPPSSEVPYPAVMDGGGSDNFARVARNTRNQKRNLEMQGMQENSMWSFSNPMPTTTKTSDISHDTAHQKKRSSSRFTQSNPLATERERALDLKFHGPQSRLSQPLSNAASVENAEKALSNYHIRTKAFKEGRARRNAKEKEERFKEKEERFNDRTAKIIRETEEKKAAKAEKQKSKETAKLNKQEKAAAAKEEREKAKEKKAEEKRAKRGAKQEKAEGKKAPNENTDQNTSATVSEEEKAEEKRDKAKNAHFKGLRRSWVGYGFAFLLVVGVLSLAFYYSWTYKYYYRLGGATRVLAVIFLSLLCLSALRTFLVHIKYGRRAESAGSNMLGNLLALGLLVGLVVMEVVAVRNANPEVLECVMKSRDLADSFNDDLYKRKSDLEVQIDIMLTRIKRYGTAQLALRYDDDRASMRKLLETAYNNGIEYGKEKFGESATATKCGGAEKEVPELATVITAYNEAGSWPAFQVASIKETYSTRESKQEVFVRNYPICKKDQAGVYDNRKRAAETARSTDETLKVVMVPMDIGKEGDEAHKGFNNPSESMNRILGIG